MLFNLLFVVKNVFFFIGNGTLTGPPTHPSELPPLAAASMWTRKDVQEFKAGLVGDKEGVLTVGSGECVTVSR
ncbi:MAG: hypothetical protein AAGK05_16945, partial [Pseudomonadota bacterium]